MKLHTLLDTSLHSKRAIQVNIAIMRAFIRLKQVLATHKEVSRKLRELEQRMDRTDSQVQQIFDAIRKMIEPGTKPKKIGFLSDRD